MNSFTNSKTLIVGIDSQIGTTLAGFLVDRGLDVYGTTRKLEKTGEKKFYFDLLKPTDSLPLPSFDFVIICAAVTNIAECEDARERSELINVTNTIALIDRCLASDCFVIYPSSNAVFDGTAAFNRHDDEPRPRSMYGRFKLAIEDHIAKTSSVNAAVLRFTKIVGKRTPFLRTWLENAEKGLEIKAYQDSFFSPLPIEEAVAAIFTVMEKRRPGLFQLGGNQEITYLDYARSLFAGDPAKLALLKPARQPEPKPYFNHHNSLARRLLD